MKSINLRRILSIALTAMLILSLAACGSSGDGSEKGNGKGQSSGEEDYVWVPYYIGISMEENSYMGSISFVGSNMYYSYTIYGEKVSTRDFRCLDLAAPDAPPEVLYTMEEEEYDPDAEFSTYMSNIAASGDGGVLLIEQTQPVITNYDDPSAWEWRTQQTTFNLRKIGTDGSELFNVDITRYVKMDPDSTYVQYLMADGEGRIFVSNGSYIWVFEADGTHTADIALNEAGNGWMRGMGFMSDGRLAIIQNSNTGDTEIKIYNEEKKNFSDVYKNLPPNVYNSGISAGPEGSVLLEGESSLYAYYPETQTYTELLQWLKSDMNPDYVEDVSMLDEETIAVYYRDWNSSEPSIVLLKKTPASEVVVKQTLVLGCMSISQDLQSAVVNFNKNNNEYRIEVREYAASMDWSQNNAQDAYIGAQTQLNNDILTGNAPDLFVASDINLGLFAQKGVIEDLSPYLESSSVVNRSDLIGPVLDAYTNSGILCIIPTSFTVSTLVGRTSELGDQIGWTLDEMIAYSEQYPDAMLYTRAYRDAVLRNCLTYDFDSYVNWETGECFFDSENFKRVLELANQYPEEMDWSISEPTLLKNHEALLYNMDLDSFHKWQLAELMFKEAVTPIGFPSSNGTGVIVSGSGGVCISATSTHKEACFSFIESMLTIEAQSNNMFMWGFPILKSAFDSKLEKAMEPNYMLDENGEIMLNENGEPMEFSTYGYSWNDVSFELYSVSEEEAAAIWETINRISGTADYDEEIMNIIEEECGAYFAGQKSVDKVVEIIQGKVQMYVSESR